MQEYVSLPDPEELEIKRVDFSLGLRSSIRYYNDIVAPGIGNVVFVRQLTWSCLALKHARELGVSAIKLANALEALGLKAHFHTTDNYQYRGKRAFSRSKFYRESYKELAKKENYVQVTYRQNTTRTLPEDTGLGFVESGSTFDNFILSPIGMELVNQHGKHYSPGNVIGLWTKGYQSPSIQKALDYFGPSPCPGEKRVVFNRIMSDVINNFPGIRGDLGRRKNIINVFEKLPDEWNSYDILSETRNLNLFTQDYNKSQDFFAMLASGRKLLEGLYTLLANTGSRIKTGRTGLNEEIAKLIETSEKFLKTEDGSQKLHFEAARFASTIVSHKDSPEFIVAEVANRDGRVALLIDDEIVEGPLFNKDDLPKSDNFDFAVPVPFLRNFYKLWVDCL